MACVHRIVAGFFVRVDPEAGGAGERGPGGGGGGADPQPGLPARDHPQRHGDARRAQLAQRRSEGAGGGMNNWGE